MLPFLREVVDEKRVIAGCEDVADSRVLVRKTLHESQVLARALADLPAQCSVPDSRRFVKAAADSLRVVVDELYPPHDIGVPAGHGAPRVCGNSLILIPLRVFVQLGGADATVETLNPEP